MPDSSNSLARSEERGASEPPEAPSAESPSRTLPALWRTTCAAEAESRQKSMTTEGAERLAGP